MRTTLALTMLLLLPGLAGAQDPLADQLRKAVVEEEAHQDLDKAILAYQAIVRRYDEQRATAGAALFRLAECFRKQGRRDEAVAAYRRVAREFADVARLAAASERHLSVTYGIEPESSSLASPDQAVQLDALRRYRESLKSEYEILLKQYAHYLERTKVGVMLDTDPQIIAVQREMLQLERRLAELEAGMGSLRKPAQKR